MVTADALLDDQDEEEEGDKEKFDDELDEENDCTFGA